MRRPPALLAPPRLALVALVALAALAAAAFACARPTVELEIDTSVVAVDGQDGGVACSSVTDLPCVNFLLFEVLPEGSFESESHCLPLARPLTSLCEVGALATGAEIFRLDPDTSVQITVTGQRIFPARGCMRAACARAIFTAQTSGYVRLRDVGDQGLKLALTLDEACGPIEEYYTRPRDVSCDEICGAGLVACDEMPDGCLCITTEGQLDRVGSEPDAGVSYSAR